MTRRWSQPAAAALLLACLAAAVGITPLTNNDIWLHLTTGRLILERGDVPRADEYSFTRAGSPYIAHEWLAQILFTLGARAGGVTGLITLKPLALWAAALLVAWAAARLGAGPEAALGAGGVALLAMASHLYVRPHLLTFVLLSAVSCLLVRPPGWGRQAVPWWAALLILQLLWANVHGGFILGIALALLLGRWLAAVSMALVSLINPYGWELFRFVFIFTDPVFRSRIREWSGPFQPPFVGSFHFFVYLLVLAAAVATAALLLRRRRWGPAAALAGFCLLSWASKRNASLLALVALPWIAATLIPAVASTLVPAVASTLIPAAAPRGAPAGGSRTRGTWMVAAALIILTALAAWRGLPHESGAWRRPGLGIGENVPVAAVDWMLSQGIEGRALASFAFASYITYRCWPASLVLIDSRLDVYGGAMVERYFQAMAHQDAARRMLDEDRPDYALISYRLEDTGGMLAALDEQPGWGLVWFDDLAMLYVRDEPRWADLLARARYRAASPYGFLAGGLAEAAVPQLLEETERALAAAPGSRIARLMRATALQRAARHGEALRLLDDGASPSAGDAQEQALRCGLRATSLAALGRREDALEAARQMRDLLPESEFARSLIEELGGVP